MILLCPVYPRDLRDILPALSGSIVWQKLTDINNYRKLLKFHSQRFWFSKTKLKPGNLIWVASLVAQWLIICLPMQGTWVRALVQEDPTCRGATKPVHHNYWACALEPVSHNYWSLRAWSSGSATREATAMRSLCTATKSSPRSPQLEKSPRVATKTQRSQK